MLAIAIGGQATGEVEPGLAAGNEVQQCRRQNAADHLRDDVGRQLLGWKTPAGCQPDRDGRIQMTTGDMPDGERHRQDRKPECERNTEQADAYFGESRCQHGTATASQYQPERTQQLGCHPLP
ncbi:hypothetical protein D9M72_572530 [compost metagenome]